ncbi:MAG: FAD-binding dehydrogenase [Steroidobacteraceae bacterium]|nr:FAD-binding dehydrogenase [Steroidobacteraceae bacterium]
MDSYRYSADVVIAGAGIAGIAAAIEALDRGRRVLLLDRDERDNLGGLARESMGGLWFAGSALQARHRLRDSVELGYADWLAFGELAPEDRWPRAWARSYVERCIPEVFEWLRGLGVEFLPMPMWVERGLYGQGNSMPRFHVVWGTGRALADAVIARLMNHPERDRLDLRFGHRVDALVRRGGRVAGLAGATEPDGRPFEVAAESVVVAAGGINGDIERVRRHWHADWGAPPTVILNGSHRFADGRLHDAAAAAGASVTHLDWQWNYAAGIRHWRPRKPGHGLSLIPPKSALWLNARGERIGPMPLVAGYDTHDLVAKICAEPGGYSWQLLNRRIALKELAVSGAEFNPAIRDRRRLRLALDLLFGNRWLYHELTRNSEDFVVAGTLPELVERMNALNGDATVELACVEAAVVQYDGAIARGERFHNDEQLRRIAFARRWPADRLRTCRFQRILDPGAGPLLAIREYIISRKSMGGIQTDLSCRALDHGGEPIEGLYAVGEAAGFGGGGMNGKRGLEGTFLGGCLLTGRVAGRNA